MNKLLIPILTAASINTAHAQDLAGHAKNLGAALANCAIFGAVGVVMLLIGFKIFDKAITKVDLEQEIQKGNVAAGVLSGAVLIALAIIVAAAMS
jgi:putative membrane protein